MNKRYFMYDGFLVTELSKNNKYPAIAPTSGAPQEDI